MTTGSATLAINSGSSSVKCALFTFEREPQTLARATIEGSRPAVEPRLLDWIDRNARTASLAGVGHRIVHGGPDLHAPRAIDPPLVDTLTRLIPFAPNHLPDELALIRLLDTRLPDVPQMACFDTGFHADLPDVARRLPIPHEYDRDGVRRYGFHGLSYTFLVSELRRRAGPESAAGRVVLAHLGHGSSLAAVHGGRSVDTTMAFTPGGGVMMSTRSGDLDPGVVTYLARHGRLTPDELDELLTRRSGLLGVSTSSGDMRELLARESTDPASRLAVAMYVHAVKKAIGALAAVLGGLDTIVFSGGIGEHAPAIRRRICEGLDYLGLRLDEDRNAANGPIVSASGARATAWVIPTDEEIVIARAAYDLFNLR